MSATYLHVPVSDPVWGELNSIKLLDPYSHFINTVLAEVAEEDHPEPPTFAEVYDVLFHGADFGEEAEAIHFRFYAHGLMVEVEHIYGSTRYTLDERMIFEDRHFYDPGTFDWSRLGDLHTMISFVRPQPVWTVVLNIRSKDSEFAGEFDSFTDALVEAARLAVIDGRAYTVVTPDGDNLTVEHT